MFFIVRKCTLLRYIKQEKQKNQRFTSRKPLIINKSGKRDAASGTRTRDPQLGKLMLYQLSYCRLSKYFCLYK